MKIYHHSTPFVTELGAAINGLQVAYHTYGNLNEQGNNVIWICHALTANSDAADWWPGMVGDGKFYDPEKYFIVCANVLGSCYGTTGPLSVNPLTGLPWMRDFPQVTIRDIVAVNELLRQHLAIEHIHTVIGGSIGGFQSLEWAISKPRLFSNIILIACSAKASPWVIAFNESQRMAILADKTYMDGSAGSGQEGLKAARSMALISYRTSDAYNLTQAETEDRLGEHATGMAPFHNTTSNFRAASYQRYQGEKLVKRFNAYSYFQLTSIIDSHSIYRGRPQVYEMLSEITGSTLVIGITTDILYPVSEQKQLATIIPGAIYKEIYSDFGHDGFLIESDSLAELIAAFMFSR